MPFLNREPVAYSQERVYAQAYRSCQITLHMSAPGVMRHDLAPVQELQTCTPWSLTEYTWAFQAGVARSDGAGDFVEEVACRIYADYGPKSCRGSCTAHALPVRSARYLFSDQRESSCNDPVKCYPLLFAWYCTPSCEQRKHCAAVHCTPERPHMQCSRRVPSLDYCKHAVITIERSIASACRGGSLQLAHSLNISSPCKNPTPTCLPVRQH